MRAILDITRVVYTLKTIHVVNTPRWQALIFEGIGDSCSLRVVKRYDTKVEAVLLISLSDPDNHVYLFKVLFSQSSAWRRPVFSWPTYFIAVSSLRFDTFPNIDECYTRMILDVMARLQLSVIDLL